MIRWFIIYPLIALFALALSWRYLPYSFQEQIGAFVGAGITRSTGTIKTASGEEIILPQEPKERRRVLIGELKKSVDEIKRQTEAVEPIRDETNLGEMNAPEISSPKTSPSGESKEEVIKIAEEIIKELEDANGDSSTLKEKIVERIIEKIFPAPPPAECRN